MPLFKLTGDLKLLENPSIAYSFISDDTGRRAMALMFRYLNLNSDIRYYIPAGMLTFSTNKTHEPLFQKWHYSESDKILIILIQPICYVEFYH